MKILAFNGSPRKNGNTAILLNHALNGAASRGAETELVHLYDLDYKGCRSCFACKLKGGKSYGKCAWNDGLAQYLQEVEETADALLFGAPIYFGLPGGEMRSFLERLFFPKFVYDEQYSSLFKRKVPNGFIYTMNVTEEVMKSKGYDQSPRATEFALTKMFGSSETLFVNDTYQFDDYSKYEVTVFNAEDKGRRRREVFPGDCKKAFELGVRLTRA